MGIKHGMAGSREFNTWISMKQRCSNKNDPEYKNYGGRGITVCERWMQFENFYADMGPRPLGTSIDRIDNDGNYELANCRWATPKEQGRKRRIVKLSLQKVDAIKEYRAVGLTLKEIAEKFGVSRQTILNALNGKSWN